MTISRNASNKVTGPKAPNFGNLLVKCNKTSIFVVPAALNILEFPQNTSGSNPV